MDYAALKIELLDWLKQLDDKEKMEQVLSIKTAANDEIVAYTTGGLPLTKSMYVSELEKGMKDIKDGKIKSHKDIKDKYRFNG